jgi:predicted RNA polymerase sigma factor
MEDQELIPHLFRTEFRKIAAVLCKLFGSSHLEQAEDLAGETFLAALENWTYQGVPENPVAWLYTVAKNKARNYLRRSGTFQHKILVELKKNLPEAEQAEPDFSEGNITDSQLKMLFAVCHPGISKEAQIGLALRILCGFGIDCTGHGKNYGKKKLPLKFLRTGKSEKDWKRFWRRFICSLVKDIIPNAQIR